MWLGIPAAFAAVLPLGSGCGEAHSGADAPHTAGEPQSVATDDHGPELRPLRALPEPAGPGPDPLAVRTIELPFVPTAAAVSGDGRLLAVVAPGEDSSGWQRGRRREVPPGLPERTRLLVLEMPGGELVLDRELPTEHPTDLVVTDDAQGGQVILYDPRQPRLLAVAARQGGPADRVVELEGPISFMSAQADRLLVLAGRPRELRELALPGLDEVRGSRFQRWADGAPRRYENLWDTTFAMLSPDLRTVEMVMVDTDGSGGVARAGRGSSTVVRWGVLRSDGVVSTAGQPVISLGNIGRRVGGVLVWSRHPLAMVLERRPDDGLRRDSDGPVTYALHLHALQHAAPHWFALAGSPESEIVLARGRPRIGGARDEPGLPGGGRILETADGVVVIGGDLLMIIPEKALLESLSPDRVERLKHTPAMIVPVSCIVAMIAPGGPDALPVPLYFPLPQGVKHAVVGQQTLVPYLTAGGVQPVRFEVQSSSRAAATIDELSGVMTIPAEQPEVLDEAGRFFRSELRDWPERPEWDALLEERRTRMREDFQIQVQGLPIAMHYRIIAEDASGRRAHLDHAVVFDVPVDRLEALYAERRAEEMARRER